MCKKALKGIQKAIKAGIRPLPLRKGMACGMGKPWLHRIYRRQQTLSCCAGQLIVRGARQTNRRLGRGRPAHGTRIRNAELQIRGH